MARAIDGEAAYRFLSEQLVKETGAFSKGVNKGLNIARSAMRNPDAIPALRTPTREQVEKMRGEWMGSADGYADGELVYDTWECSHCGYVIDEEDDPDMLPQFCPKCCSIMTDEAVEMVMERLNGIK